MSNPHKEHLLKLLTDRFGGLRLLSGSRSLFSIGGDAARIYLRYSKLHEDGRTFFGLREADLRSLEGHNGFICFFLDDGSQPLVVPYSDFEEIFRSSQPASDGQHKVQLFTREDSCQLYVAKQGRFNVDAYAGLGSLERSLQANLLRPAANLTHSQVQTLLAAVGNLKGFDVWIPDNNVGMLDWTIASPFSLRDAIPAGFESVAPILAEVDVVWLGRGGNEVMGLFEVEHSTPIYSGLLRFNDLLLTAPRLSRFHIVSNESRRALFSRQLFRPTFRASGLSELVSFLEYPNVLDWHSRLRERSPHAKA